MNNALCNNVTGEVLVNRILEVFKEYGIDEHEVKNKVVFVSDRGPNIKYGLINAGFMRLTCYCHIIHNLVSAMFAEPRVKDTIQDASSLSSYVKNSGMNVHLKNSLKRYTTTRWNSVFIMIDAIIESHNKLYDLLYEKQQIVNDEKIKQRKKTDNSIIDLLTKIKFENLIEIHKFLQPFKV